MNELIAYFQLGANAVAVAAAGWIYLAYVKNIRSMLEVKDEQLKVLDRTVAFRKDKAADFEKKTPEFIEEVLGKRIRLREEEIQRLSADQETHAKTVSMRTREVERLRARLEQTAYIGHALTYYDSDSQAELPIPEEEVALEELGEFFVDSASVLITDPMYVQSEWDRDEPFVEDRRYIHGPSDKTYVFGEDFTRFDEVLPGLSATANDLMKTGELRKINVSVQPRHLELSRMPREHRGHDEDGGCSLRGDDCVGCALAQRCRAGRVHPWSSGHVDAARPCARAVLSRQAATCGAATPRCGCSTAWAAG